MISQKRCYYRAMLITQIILILLFLFIIFWQGSMLFASIIGPPIVYSSKGAIRDCLRLAGLKPGETLLDLGCGNGRVLLIGAREFGAKGIGVDRSPYSSLKARWNIRLGGQAKNITILRKAFAEAENEIKQADVIYLYLLPRTMVEIEPWMTKTISSKTRLVSLGFEFTKHTPVAEKETINLHRKSIIRLYRK